MDKADLNLCAPRCVQCDSEMPCGVQKYPELCVCQNPECPNYGIFQAGKRVMKQMDEDFPFNSFPSELGTK